MNHPAVRVESDTFGPIDVPAHRLWGAQTQRSLQNFDISGERQPREIIRALAQVKRASAVVNHALGLQDERKTQAIVQAADEVIAGAHEEEFPLVVWQTGSGTQTNMNVNEVLANRASELLGGERGPSRLVHPNDDVNRSQSSNDVFPTAMHVAAVDAITHRLLPSLDLLKNTLVLNGDGSVTFTPSGISSRTLKPATWVGSVPIRTVDDDDHLPRGSAGRGPQASGQPVEAQLHPLAVLEQIGFLAAVERALHRQAGPEIPVTQAAAGDMAAADDDLAHRAQLLAL